MNVTWRRLYKEEKEKNKNIPIGELYGKIYKLSGNIDCFSLWKFTDFVFLNDNDNVLVYLHYRTRDKDESGWWPYFEYDFYVVESNGLYYIQYFNVLGIVDMAKKCGEKAIPILQRS